MSLLTHLSRNTSRSAGTELVVDAKVKGEANSRFTADANGKLRWGPGGATALDTTLERTAANKLKTPGDFEVAGTMTIAALSGVLKASAGAVSGSATTSDLPEGSNLYWTQSRFDTALAAKTTANLAEGSNLYFTNTRVDDRITSTWRGLANGLASLDGSSKIPTAQLPALAITDTHVVASQAAMLALTAETGDVAVRTDLNKSFILDGTDALAQAAQLTDDYREQLQALAGQFQETTGIADDKWLGVLAKLTQFGADNTNIEKYTDAVKNLAGIIGGDIETAAMMFARAMQGNFDLFSRYGIVVGEAGSQTEKLNGLMIELAQRGGGQLEAQARTLTGQYGSLKNAISDLFEAIGRGASQTGILQNVLSGATQIIGAWAEILGGTIPQVDGLTNATKRTIQTFDDAAPASKSFESRLKSVGVEAEALQKQVAAVTSEIRHFQRIQAELESKEKALRLAQVDEAEATGRISASQAIRQRATIEDEFSKRQTAQETQANKDVLKNLEEGMRAAAAREVELQKRLTDLEKRMAAQKPTEQLRQELEEPITSSRLTGEAALERARQRKLAAEDALIQGRAAAAEAPADRRGFKSTAELLLPELERKFKEAEQEFDRLQKRVSQLNERIPEGEKSQAALSVEQEKLTRLLQETQQAYKGFKEDLERQRHLLEKENAALEQGALLDSRVRDLKTRQQLRIEEGKQQKQIIQDVKSGRPTASVEPSINVSGLISAVQSASRQPATEMQALAKEFSVGLGTLAQEIRQIRREFRQEIALIRSVQDDSRLS